MKINRKTQLDSEIPTASMPDIIFMLLIFFMVTTVLREYSGLPNAVKETRMILYADDAVLFCDASTRQELQIALEREFTEISNWYTDNRLTINVKKTKFMLAGSKMMLSLFEDFEL